MTYDRAEQRPALRYDPRDADPLYRAFAEPRPKRPNPGRVLPGAPWWEVTLAALVTGFVIGFTLALLIGMTAQSRTANGPGAMRPVDGAITTAHIRSMAVEDLSQRPARDYSALTRRGQKGAETAGLFATLSGYASWYCSSTSACTRGYSGSDLVAAIDPSTGIDKGELVTVRHDGRTVLVRIVDTCQCAGRRVIDLTSGAFSRLAPLSAGVIPVTLTTGASLPQTDTLP